MNKNFINVWRIFTMKDFGTLYIVQNTPTIAENALKNYLWHNKEISETIEKSCNHAKEYRYCDVDLLRASVNAELFSILQSKENFQKFINEQRKKLVSPACRSAKDYLVKMWETEESLENVYNFLRRA